jgi:hypothetical protein
MKQFDEIPLDHIPWIEKQEMFWVATAPLSGDGHINVSPKGVRDCFSVLNQKKVWYEDLTGSGGFIYKCLLIPENKTMIRC